MLIEAEVLSISMDGRTVLEEESVRCEPGVMTALVGPSGSGKTTLLNCLALLLAPHAGRVLVEGKDVTNAGSAARRRFWRDHAAFVLQDYGIMDQESLAFNVTMRSPLLGRRSRGGDERLQQVLDQTGLATRQDETASHLSGGEKQRLALARAIYKQASVLFVDEPTASLDAANRRKVIELFTGLAAGGCTVIVSTHDAELVEACASRHQVGAARSRARRQHEQPRQEGAA